MNEVLRRAMECPCCFEVMAKPVSFASCGHSFCSLCIRRFLQQQQRNNARKHCPVCNAAQPEGEAGLVSCLALTNVIEILLAHGSDSQPATSTAAPAPSTLLLRPLSRLPTLVYHLLGEDRLDSALEAWSLPFGAHVAKQRKIALHREYTLQTNNLVDSGQLETDPSALAKSVLTACASKNSLKFGGASTQQQQQQQPARKRQSSTSSLKQVRAHERKRWKPARVAAEWRAVFSDTLNKPVYINSTTNECTTQRPPELEREQEDDSVVVVVHELL